MSPQSIIDLRTDAGATTFLAPQRSTNGEREKGDPPGDGGVYDPPPPPPDSSRGERLRASALAWLDAVESWQKGSAYFAEQRYASAVQAYDHCQRATLTYFSSFPDYNLQAASIDELVFQIVSAKEAWADLWGSVIWRRQLLSLAELAEFDWSPVMPWDSVSALLRGNLDRNEQAKPLSGPIFLVNRKELMDARLLVLAAVLVPLARGEANRLRREYAAAIDDFVHVLSRQVPVPNSDPPQTVPAPLSCEFIEIPFAWLLLAETMLDQAEAQYKARLSVDDEPDDPPDHRKTTDLARLVQTAQDFDSRHIAGDADNATKPFQHLVAALTYAGIMDALKEDVQYVTRAKLALDTLHAQVASTVASGDVASLAFRSLGKAVTVPTIGSLGSTLPGLTDGTHPHEPYLQFNSPDGQPMRERNPRVYALLLQAQSRLLQIWSGFNYLGYRDDYVPPWRFNYLLDRARYFAEHAKNAQRDYLNFLNNAENEENRELSAAQNVELEKANVQIETARVDQATKEVATAQESKKLADENASDAQQRVTNYQNFANYADDLFDSHLDNLFGLSKVLDNLPGLNADLTGLGDAFSGGFISSRKNALSGHAQREVELKNLKLVAQESQQSAKIADAQLAVSKAGLVVAGLQRQASLLRHEFALQNLEFIRNQTLNTEQWYRLAGAIRSVSDTYLRYAIEISFLAQQAYNFEWDKRLNVIRFDYDASAVGSMLAGDFLLRDLDSFEQDLVVSQQTRQQQVRYVLSMAREFPETLKALADTGEVIFSMRLEQLERHFPGLFDLRISSVDVQPFALMDPTRVSVELTHLGTGMLRLKAQPGTSPLNTTDLAPNGQWLSTAETDWPVKVHVSGLQTAVFSGPSSQDAAGLGMIATNERRAFEGLPGASSWRIDMSMKENQVVPGTLADVVITFMLTGFYDEALKQMVRDAVASAQRSFATTSLISARSALPDAYYSLVHYGKLDWAVSERMLTLNGAPNELHNLGVILPLAPDGPEIGRCYCRYSTEIQIASGTAKVLTALPQLTMTSNGLVLNCAYTGTASASWDFGDGAPIEPGASVAHTYARPGRYDVTTRLIQDSRLFEYRSAVVVSANHPVAAPLAIAPVFSASPIGPDGSVTLTVSPPSGMTDVGLDCSAGTVRARSDTGPVTLELKPGTYVLDFLATRKLPARFYGKQRYLPDAPISLDRGRIATNRTFDAVTGTETTASLNAFGTQLFRNGNAAVTLSPVDRWTLDLPQADNPWFTTVSPSDVAEFDGGELADAILTLEFVGP